ncbi:nitrite reductase small subunit NirD [Effusibacillus consociatus]|uniref:Nitrite reductase small subunit NirD n=1 Tax=Effusibacillus consociatus TaxID=1117041 RepID=A0ABV9Q121_9BACL
MEAVKVEVATLEELPVQTGRVVKLNGREIAVFRLSSGEVRAVENRCPHKGGPLAEGIVSGEYVFCPLHDWKIDLKDGQVQAPDTGCVTTYKVDVIGNKVYISM